MIAEAPPVLDGTSDAALIQAIACRDHGALTTAFRVHGGRVTALARLRCVDGAEDVAQDVFLRLWQHPERFDPALGSLRSYLLMLTSSRATDVARSTSARRAREDRLHRRPARAATDVATDCASAQDLAALLERLPLRQREALSLAFVGGLTYREVAERLDEPIGTVKSRIRNALIALRPFAPDEALPTLEAC